MQPDQIWYGGLVRAESAMRIMSDIGSKLTHTFQVTNDGPWHVEDFNVLIEWPHRLVTSTQPLGKENREFLVKSAQKFPIGNFDYTKFHQFIRSNTKS